jgi:cathepsin B
MKTIFIYFILVNIIVSIFSGNENQEIPDKFDVREKWPNCVSKVYNQGSCGACYAISVATAFSMRFCIKNNLTQIIQFSPQNLVNCLSGCKGEFPDVTWDYLNEHGITTDECMPYKNSQDSCNMRCDLKTNKFENYHSGKTKFLEDEISIKKEIMKNGPVTSMLNIYSDYYSYNSGIYTHKQGNGIIGFHSIAIIGWGVENDEKYWLIQDSYGNASGENGYMRIKIGDDCGVGATAFCDEIEGIYEKEEIIINNNSKSSKSFLNLNNCFIIFIILFIF